MYPQGVCRIRKPAYAGNGCAIFPAFDTAQLGKKIRCSAADDLFRGSLIILRIPIRTLIIRPGTHQVNGERRLYLYYSDFFRNVTHQFSCSRKNFYIIFCVFSLHCPRSKTAGGSLSSCCLVLFPIRFSAHATALRSGSSCTASAGSFTKGGACILCRPVCSGWCGRHRPGGRSLPPGRCDGAFGIPSPPPGCRRRGYPRSAGCC